MSKPSAPLEALGALARWFERQKRVLPWRDEPAVYRVWISEIMLQQTQVATVVPYFERFLARFPSVDALAAAPLEDVLLHWAGLGYYSRARNLHRAAQLIVERGRFPETHEEWLELPGIGAYTSGAIRSIAQDQVAPILDGNVERVMARLRRVSRARGDAAYKARLWRLARIAVARAAAHGIRPGVTNQALMELGATVCTPKTPRCQICPLAPICRANESADVEQYPPKKKPKKWIEVREELHCYLDDEGRVLLRQREKGEWRSGLWDLLDVKDVTGAQKLGSVETRHVVTRHKVTRVTHVWRVPGSKTWRAGEEEGLKWISIAKPEVAVGSALKRTLKSVRERFEGEDLFSTLRPSD